MEQKIIMKNIIITFLFLFVTKPILAQYKINDDGPKAYFGYVGLDSMSLEDFIKYDTLKMDNVNIKILRFILAVSCYDCENVTTDVTLIPIEGDRISNHKEWLSKLLSTKNRKVSLTVMEIEFLNSKGKFIKYPREFSFKLY